MLRLNTKEIEAVGKTTRSDQVIARISTNPNLPAAVRSSHIFLAKKSDELPGGFSYVFCLEDSLKNEDIKASDVSDVYQIPQYLNFVGDGDIVRFNPLKGMLNVLYRKSSAFNALLVTERCNNFCLMCSQPPKDIDDSYIVQDLLKAIPLMSRSSPEICITGGEPTLLGDDLLRLLKALKGNLPSTAVHVLSNGRRFSDPEFTAKMATINHHDLMYGIPVYSDVSNIHDYVVQADGAFDETIRGILNLKQNGQRVEIRVVLHKQTYKRLPQLAMFLARNLLFVDHVALMGLENMGFTKFNMDDLWIDPYDYQKELRDAVEILHRYRMNVSIYNLQLCLLDDWLKPFARKSDLPQFLRTVN